MEYAKELQDPKNKEVLHIQKQANFVNFVPLEK
jgi:hypothetical protein